MISHIPSYTLRLRALAMVLDSQKQRCPIYLSYLSLCYGGAKGSVFGFPAISTDAPTVSFLTMNIAYNTHFTDSDDNNSG